MNWLKDALNIISKDPISRNEEELEINYICNKLDISREELMTYFNTTKKMYYDYKSNYLIIQIVTYLLRILGYEKRLF